MAGSAIIFGRYTRELTGWAMPEQAIAAIALGVLTMVNCFGVRAGSNVQSAFMITKIAAIAMLIGVGFFLAAPVQHVASATLPNGTGGLAGFGAAMVPVLFAYGGWQTASFLSGEMRDPRRDLPRGLLIGVVGVIVLYLAVTLVCLRVLGVDGLAATSTPASTILRSALGERGARLIALGIAVSTVGFLSQGVLTAPRVYFAMARDGVFFKAVGKLDPRSRVPIVAIVIQGVWAVAIALAGKYDQILNYVVSIDVLFFGLTGASLLVFRARESRGGRGGTDGYACPVIRSRRCSSRSRAGPSPRRRSCSIPRTRGSAWRFCSSGRRSTCSGRASRGPPRRSSGFRNCSLQQLNAETQRTQRTTAETTVFAQRAGILWGTAAREASKSPWRLKLPRRGFPSGFQQEHPGSLRTEPISPAVLCVLCVSALSSCRLASPSKSVHDRGRCFRLQSDDVTRSLELHLSKMLSINDLRSCPARHP